MPRVSFMKIVFMCTLLHRLHLADFQKGTQNIINARKCCPATKKYDLSDFYAQNNPKCQDSTAVSFLWPPEVFDFDANDSLNIPTSQWVFDVGNPVCSNNRTASYISEDLFTPTNDVFLASNGFLYLKKYQIALDPDQFCVEEIADNNQAKLVAKYCSAIIGKNEVHIRKCCTEGFAPNLDNKKLTCNIPYSKPLKLDFTSAGALGSPKINFSIGFPKCNNDFYMLNTKDIVPQNMSFTLNGELRLENGVHIPSLQYCVDHIFEEKTKPSKVNALICFPENQPSTPSKANPVNPITVYIWASILAQIITQYVLPQRL